MASRLYNLNTRSALYCPGDAILSNCKNNRGFIYRLCQGGPAPTNNKIIIRKEKEKLRGYVLSRYMDYVTNYRTVLEARFPSAMNIYRIFSVGLKEFYKDLKMYIPKRIRYPPTENNLMKLSRREVELYYTMPRDMWRIAPVLILSAVPFGNYVIFPLALMRPRALLTPHFWSVQQRAEFPLLELRERLAHQRPVLRALEARLESVRPERARSAWRDVLADLGSGVHPTPRHVLHSLHLFEHEPYGLSELSYWHVDHLLRMHGLHRGLMRRKRLRHRAFMLQQMDRAIVREGGAEALGTDGLRGACLARGLNSTHLPNQLLAEWLAQWLEVSAAVTHTSYSLLLHCPLLFAYNHPQNWKLLV